MKLLINTSYREKNCYKILNDIKENDDHMVSLAKKEIKRCMGCCECKKQALKNFCVIEDDMLEVYTNMAKFDKIVFACPIYMNFINGTTKNIIERLNTFYMHPEVIKNKSIYLIIIGEMSEEENKETVEMITKYFESLTEFMEFNFKFLGYISSGIIEEIDDIEKNNANYNDIIEKIKNSI